MKPKLSLCLALVLSGGLLGCSTATKSAGEKSIYPLSMAEIQWIDDTLPKLKPGMTGAEVKAILDQTALSGITFRSGSGPMHDYRLVYELRPGYNLILVEDLTSQPPKFVRYDKAGEEWLKP
jgi:hypothetical protein